MASNYPQCIVGAQALHGAPIVRYRGHEAFLTNDLKKFFPTVFIGIRTSKNMITEFNIPKDDYFVVKKLSDGSYEESTLTYTQSKVLIKASWFEAFMADPPQKIKDAPRVAPPLLELTENDKFVDDEGNLFEVEIRGERHEDKVRFRGRDVERVFEMDKLVDDVQKTDSGYVRIEDYEILLVAPPQLSGQLQVKETYNRKKLYFTYQGIIKVINCSRAGVAYKFKDWMKRVVFKAHMGTDWDKAELAYEVIDTTSIDMNELVRALQEKLRIQEQQIQERDARIKASEDHILLLNDLLIDNTKMEATQAIYIATSDSYALQNRFKVGGVESTEKLQPRLSTYNSRSAKGDDFFYSDVFLVVNYRQVEERLKSLMFRFRDRAKKEIYILHYTNIQHIVQYFCEHYNEELDYVNEHLTQFIDNLNTYNLRPVVPPRTSFNFAKITSCQADGSVAVAVIETNSTRALVDKIEAYVDGLTCQEINKKKVFDDLKIRTGRKKLLPVLQSVLEKKRPDITLSLKQS